MHRTRCAALGLVTLTLACGGAEPATTPDGGVAPIDAGGADAAPIDAGEAPVDAGEADAGALDAGPTTPTFAADLAPMIRLQCQGCHFVTDLPPQIFLDGDGVRDTYDRLVGQPARLAPLDYIDPGSPETSYLLLKIEDRHRAAGGGGDHMPPPTANRRLPNEDVARIRAWIEAGAPF